MMWERVKNVLRNEQRRTGEKMTTYTHLMLWDDFRDDTWPALKRIFNLDKK